MWGLQSVADLVIFSYGMRTQDFFVTLEANLEFLFGVSKLTKNIRMYFGCGPKYRKGQLPGSLHVGPPVPPMITPTPSPRSGYLLQVTKPKI